MGLQSEPPLHREVIETEMTICRYPHYQSEPPLHREVIETSPAKSSITDRIRSEPPLHREVIEPKNPDIRKDTGIFSIKNLKNAEKLVYIVKGKNVSRNLNYSEKRVDTCLILW